MMDLNVEAVDYIIEGEKKLEDFIELLRRKEVQLTREELVQEMDIIV